MIQERTGAVPLPDFEQGVAMDRVPPSLAQLELVDSDGAPRRLGSLWAERPAALVFLRHFG